ncbi:metal ABC transporter permease [Mycobacterium montefiorense]|uniref:metal ABC transporter permease n=2 Tax=Mycobacterium montefiorense TaxID=154654 RepID=UPI0021F2BA61|nr:metal ABC transporter permease [Mycobacterium montefiorense]MCV7427773.1 metal ABC transporter permease [Mycobacterium montefiorense]
MNPQLTWNLIADVQQMLVYPFMVTALRAGTVVAVLAGVVGWVMVLRKESFAGHTLAVVGFPGAAAAAWLGVATGYGYFAASIGAAAAITLLPKSTQTGRPSLGEESAGIGTIQAFAMATGFLFVSLYHGFLSGLTNLLFGTIAGVSSQQLDVLLLAALVCLIVLAAIGRPLLWASIDPDAATANGVPTRFVAALFLLVLGAAAAGASQITGSLLVFALLVAPSAAAFHFTARPAMGIALSVIFAVTVTWLGIGCAFYSPFPIGFWVSSFAFGVYLLAVCYRASVERSQQRFDRRRSPACTTVAA